MSVRLSMGKARQVLVTVSAAGQLEVRLPGGETVRLHRFQAQQLRAAVEQGMGVVSRAGGRRDGRGVAGSRGDHRLRGACRPGWVERIRAG